MDCNYALDFVLDLDKESPKKDSRETLYHCVEHLLYALLSEAGDSEKQALYRSLEHLGIAQIKWLNASAESLTGSSADASKTTEVNQS